MSDLMVLGAQWGSQGVFKPETAGISSAQRIQDAHARYMDAVMAGRVWKLSAAAAAPSAYVGAAAGTPLLAIHNPLGSNKYASLIGIGIAGRAAASAAGQTGLNIFSGPSVLPTGTVSAPQNVLSKASSGSSMVAFVNTALTGSTALSLSLPLWTYYWATAAGAIQSVGFFDCAGLELLIPGNQLAVGLSVALTSATYDIAMYWEELPYMTLAA